MRAIIYCRKSTDRGDRQQLSIESQLIEANKIAEREGLKIIKIFKETKTAKEPGREFFNEMMKIFSKGKADCIITWKLNRLARNPIDEGTIKWSLQNGTIKAIFTEGEVFKTGDNVLIMGMHFGMSTQYILDLQKDIKRGQKEKIAKGGVNQKAPLGFLNNKLEKNIEIDPIKSKRVKEIFELRAGKMAVSSISKILFDKGIRRNNGTAFPITTIESIIRNKFYIGLVKYNGTYYKGNYKTFISEKLFNNANNFSNGLFEHNKKIPGIQYPLKGIIKDSKGLILNGYKTKGYTYYKSQSKSSITVNISEIKLFQKIGEILKKYQMEGKFKEFNKKIAFKLLEKYKPNEQKELLEIDKEIKNLNNKKDNLLELRLEGEINKDVYTKKYNDIIFKINNLESKKNNFSSKKDELKISKGVELACSLYNTYKQGSNNEKSIYLRKLGVELFLDNKKELSIQENSLLKFINFLNFHFGGT